MKKLIINADDFGYSKENNEAIKKGFEAGLITSTSIMSNMDDFEDAINLLPQISNIDLGIHLNIIEGKSLTNPSMLCNKEGFFNNSYGEILIKSAQNEFLNQIEKEFKAQIEKTLQHHQITHIDSHVHTHAIPSIFDLTVKLAKEYNIKSVRTQKEIPYIVLNKSFNTKFPINIIKNILLNTFSYIDKKKIKYTNDYFIGVLYTGFMEEQTIIEGLRKITQENSITEIIFHPCCNKNKKYNYKEFLITQNPNFKDELRNLGFVLSNYSDII